MWRVVLYSRSNLGSVDLVQNSIRWVILVLDELGSKMGINGFQWNKNEPLLTNKDPGLKVSKKRKEMVDKTETLYLVK